MWENITLKNQILRASRDQGYINRAWIRPYTNMFQRERHVIAKNWKFVKLYDLLQF